MEKDPISIESKKQEIPQSEYPPFKDHIKNVEKNKKSERLAAIINGLTDPYNKNLATYLLGEDAIEQPAIQPDDTSKIIKYISDFEQINPAQTDVIDYIYERIEEEENLVLDAHDPEIDSLLYGYEAGVDVSREIKKLEEKSYLSDEERKDLAVIRTAAKYVLEDKLYFPCTDPDSLMENVDFISSCYDSYLISLKDGEELLTK